MGVGSLTIDTVGAQTAPSAISATVVRAGPIVWCSFTVAATMRSRVRCCRSARAFSRYVRLGVSLDTVFIDYDTLTQIRYTRCSLK